MVEDLKKDLENIKRKFSLEEIDEARKISSEFIACKNHKNKLALFECPICKIYYCSDCIKYISSKHETRQKAICINCYKRYILKSVIFFTTIFINFILMIFGVVYLKY